VTGNAYLRCLAAACAVVLASCAGNGPAPCGTGTEFSNIQCNIFNVSCLSGGCHNATDQAGSLVLTPQAESCQQLVNHVSANPVAAVMGLLRVEPGQPNNSFLITKLTGPGAGEGGQMPLNAAMLPQSQIDMISQWITNGAACTPRPVTPSATVTPLPTDTASPTETPSPTPSDSPTAADTSTVTPTVPTPTGTVQPTPTPSSTPTVTPTLPPTPTPTVTPTLPPTVTPTFDPNATLAAIQATIFTPTCIALGCHNAHDHSANLILESGQSYGQLVNVVPDNFFAAMDGLLRVEPFNPSNSFLVIKVSGVPPVKYGSQMPQGGTPLTTQQVQLITTWIAQGALPGP